MQSRLQTTHALQKIHENQETWRHGALLGSTLKRPHTPYDLWQHHLCPFWNLLISSHVVDFLLLECHSSGPKQNVMSGSSPGMHSRPTLHLNNSKYNPRVIGLAAPLQLHHWIQANNSQNHDQSETSLGVHSNAFCRLQQAVCASVYTFGIANKPILWCNRNRKPDKIQDIDVPVDKLMAPKLASPRHASTQANLTMTVTMVSSSWRKQATLYHDWTSGKAQTKDALSNTFFKAFH